MGRVGDRRGTNLCSASVGSPTVINWPKRIKVMFGETGMNDSLGLTCRIGTEKLLLQLRLTFIMLIIRRIVGRLHMWSAVACVA